MAVFLSYNDYLHFFFFDSLRSPETPLSLEARFRGPPMPGGILSFYAMDNLDELPPLPEYQLTPLPSLLPPIPDKLLTLLLPIVAYWGLSLFFHWIDTKDYFPQYRLHTPTEVLKRNRVSRWEVVRDVVLQQIIQTAVGWVLGMTEPDDFYGKEEYDVTVWARRVRICERAIPWLLAVVGFDSNEMANSLPGHPNLAGILRGGRYPILTGANTGINPLKLGASSFAEWELTVASIIYWGLVPALQFAIAIVIVDTWQYFLHRAMHMNKWMYNTFHSRHHRLYVPYAYGALYNHWFEGFLLDTLGASIAYKVAGMGTRQGMVFFTGSTIKTVDDHCGYALPWDPLQHITSNNAGYHDVHHQSWGIKTNFSQPFFTFWDRILGTVWTGGDVSARYERSRLAAQKAFELDSASQPITKSDAADSATQDPKPYQNDLRIATDLVAIPAERRQPQPPIGKAELQAAGSRQQVLEDKKSGGAGVLFDESHEEKQAIASLPRTSHKRTSSTLSAKDGFKGLRDRVTASRHSRTGGIIGMDGGR